MMRLKWNASDHSQDCLASQGLRRYDHPVTALARKTLATTSGLAAMTGAGFALAYSSIEYDDAEYKGVRALPSATEAFHACAPFAVGVALAFLVVNVVVASRGHDNATIIGASLAWLFAFTWVLACLIVWRTPYALIGQHLHP